jgi:hypothetical protein
MELVLARLRQLAAHEVGHTLGLQHNYAASPVNRSSVMDYPAPFAKLGPDGIPDLSNAYAKGIGDWDKVSIAYGYQDFPSDTDEKVALDQILSQAFARGLMYLTDQDARPPSASSSVPISGTTGNVVDELGNMKVRAAALKRLVKTTFAKARRWPHWRMYLFPCTCITVIRGRRQSSRR